VFEHALSARDDLLLFFGEFDRGTGQMLGNVPQALTPLSLIAAVMLSGEPHRRRLSPQEVICREHCRSRDRSR
jgi:hypothetical protein